MVKTITLLLLLHVALLEASSVDVDFSAIAHSESEQMLGREEDDNLSVERNSFSTLYTHLLVNYDISEDIFVTLGAKSNYVLSNQPYKTPEYLRTKLSSDDINRAIISEASINYDNTMVAINLGRLDVDFDWLLGSIDGALLMLGSDESYSLRTFWFENYRQLQYNYAMEVEDINAKEGMYGAIFKANYTYVEMSLFDYYLRSLRNIAGGNISLMYANMALNVSYTSALALELALYDYDESFVNGSIEALFGRHFLEMGYSKTGENGLLAMIQLGNFMFGQFYLSNQIDRENAQNGFLRYIYANHTWRFELLFGETHYDNSFVRIEKNLRSREVDGYIKYRYNRYLSFDVGAMYMGVDSRDPLQVNQNFVMFNGVFDYANF